MTAHHTDAEDETADPRRRSRKRRNNSNTPVDIDIMKRRAAAATTVGNSNPNNNDENTEELDETTQTISLAATTPQLLSLDTARALVDYLDAGDVLECYLLTRKAYLHMDFSSDNTNNNIHNNSTDDAGGGGGHRRSQDEGGEEEDDNKNMIPVQTTALGLRYRPPPESRKLPLTLTLEYGPNRKGRFNSHLSVPQILAVDASESRVHWDNEGQVYFTTFIAPEDYSTASFLAVMTGAVVSDLLATASLYPTNHRRYQPWQIINQQQQEEHHHPNGNNEGQHLFFRSSSDYDFVHYLFRHLASVGVQLSPVLSPVVYRLQLSALSVQRHTLTQEAHVEMTSFYEKLYRCVDSLATATVLTLPPTPGPSLAPTTVEEFQNQTNSTDSYGDTQNNSSTSSSPSPTTAPPPSSDDSNNSDNNENIPTAAPTEPTRRRQQRRDNDSKKTTPNPAASNAETTTPSPLSQQQATTEPPTATPSGSLVATASAQPSTVNLTDSESNQTTATTAAPTTEPIPSFQPSQSPTVSNAPSISFNPTPAPISNADAASEAAAAAQQAASAAGENPEQAAEAAQQAADAAQKAADATASQQAILRQEALYSGNGDAVAQTVNLCLSDPLYGIAPSPAVSDDDAESSAPRTTIYLYWDSTYYYTVEVTAPFIKVVPVAASLPQPKAEPAFSEGLLFDWFLALVLVVFFLFSILLISQHVLGRNFRIVPSLYKLQRWFFDPRNAHYDDLQEESDNNNNESKPLGAGHMYTFGQDSIPRSMGGVRTVGGSSYDFGSGSMTFTTSEGDSGRRQAGEDPLATTSGHDPLQQQPQSPIFTIDDDDLGDVELSEKRGEDHKTRHNNNHTTVSATTTTTPGKRIPLYKTKKKKDPGLVALPDLKSNTKVAVPVSLQLSGSSMHSSANSSDGG